MTRQFLNDDPTGGRVELLSGLPFAEVGGTLLRLDLYLPRVRNPSTPVVLYLHGGAWMMGSRTDFAERLWGMATRGVAVASADYRLTHEAPFPAQLHDAKAAVRWLADNASQYGLTAQSIGLWGASAGAHLAAFAAFTDGDPNWEPPHSTGSKRARIAAALLWFGYYDLALPAATPGQPMPEALRRYPPPAWLPKPLPEGYAINRLIGAPTTSPPDASARRRVSPVSHVHAAAPPLLLMHGDCDTVVSLEQSERLRGSLVAAGGRADVVKVVGANHEDDLFHQTEVLDAAAAFLLREVRSARGGVAG